MGRFVAVAGLVALAPATPARAAPPLPEELRVFVMTMGPGDHPFFKFGHNAIVVQPADRPPVVYNWGTFDFESPTLIADFLRGRLTYLLSTDSVQGTLTE